MSGFESRRDRDFSGGAAAAFGSKRSNGGDRDRDRGDR
eukprot:CAMPEP_0118869378 /NCGR_PEP_ID=MMETSP1163-20130328/12728_1 /TAXON_ID=124430 /ORGANISM="Phaeomonas parva, Strain CCMP2877" /LENGTH=37 /DNA_ID= /DNA_START= /DNA_END= /DNA_ORIENTATION=